MEIATNEGRRATETLLFDIPGQTDERVVLSAHVDGHDLAEARWTTRRVAARSAVRARGAARLRASAAALFFSVEEWALTGSAQYVTLGPASAPRLR